MLFRIEHYVLDINARTLTSEGRTQAIRPKTMSLLLFLMEHQDQVVSKQQLLQEIWDDVSVNEGVIFQSVREIRQLFADVTVIQNHPRKGYQWVGTTTALSPNQPPRDADISASPQDQAWSTLSSRPLRLYAAIILLLGLMAAWVVEHLRSAPPQVVLMPLQNYVDRNDHAWLQTSGARQLANLLRQQNIQVAVGANADSAEQAELLSAPGWTLSAALYGDVYDYKLIYRMDKQAQHFQGVIFSTSISDVMQDLVSVSQINIARPAPPPWPDNAFQDSALANAMTAYETDWESAIGQLEGYLEHNPDSDIGILYLSRLYLWQGQKLRAAALLNRPIAGASEVMQADLLYNRALLVHQDNRALALEHIRRGVELAQAPEAWLVRAKLEELAADLNYQDNQVVEALRGFLRAQSLYDQIQSPVNAAGLKLKLAALYLGQNDLEMARRSFEQARNLIRQKEMTFLYAALTEFEMQHPLLLN